MFQKQGGARGPIDIMASLGRRVFGREHKDIKHRDTEATERSLCDLCVSVFNAFVFPATRRIRALTCRTNELYEPTR
jgi:hypothetical protein